MSKGLLWDIAIEKELENKADINQNSEDSTLCVIGSKGSGKTSIILRFLDRDEAPKPTVALEYTFGRRPKGHNIAKDVGHIWELGGGTWLCKLLDVPLNPDTIMNATLAIVIDLSKPSEIWFTLEALLAAAKSRLETIIAEAKGENPQIREELKKKAWQRVGEDNPDKTLMDPFLIPLVIVGGKYDIFQDFDPEKRKVICKTLRFIAHHHGASLQFFSIKQEPQVSRMKGLIRHYLFNTAPSIKQEPQVSRMKGLIRHYLFNTAPSKTLQTEHNKPILVPAGLDSLQQIGSPPLSDKDIGRVHAKNPLQLWKHAFTSYFPQEDMTNPAMVDDPAKDPQYAEPNIDSLRAQKDEELERYRRLCERKNKSGQKYQDNY